MVGLEWEHIHLEACRLEHVMSDHLEEHLRRILNNPSFTTYGTPIPPADSDFVEPFRDVISLSRAVIRQKARKLSVRCLGEIAQQDTILLSQLSKAGLRPGDWEVLWILRTAFCHGQIRGISSLSRITSRSAYL